MEKADQVMRNRDTFDITELLGINFVLNVLKNPVCYKALPSLSKTVSQGNWPEFIDPGGFVLGMGTTMACFH